MAGRAVESDWETVSTGGGRASDWETVPEERSAPALRPYDIGTGLQEQIMKPAAWVGTAALEGIKSLNPLTAIPAVFGGIKTAAQLAFQNPMIDRAAAPTEALKQAGQMGEAGYQELKGAVQGDPGSIGRLMAPLLLGKTISSVVPKISAIRAAAKLSVAEAKVPAIASEIKTPLVQAIKPGKANFKFEPNLDFSMPELAKAAQTSGQTIAADGTKTTVPPIPNDSLNGLAENIVKAKKTLIGEGSQYEALLGPNAKTTVDTSPVADAMTKKITKRFRLQNPAAAEKIEATANTYRREMPLGDIEDFLQDANNEASSYYAKSQGKRSDAIRDPEIGHVIAEGDALRKILYGKLNELAPGSDARLIKAKWGALDNLQQEVAGRQVVFARQNPQSLSEQLSWWHGLGTSITGVAELNPMKAVGGLAQPLVARYVKSLGSPDHLIKTAFERYAKTAKTGKDISFERPPMPSKEIFGQRMLEGPGQPTYYSEKPSSFPRPIGPGIQFPIPQEVTMPTSFPRPTGPTTPFPVPRQVLPYEPSILDPAQRYPSLRDLIMMMSRKQ